MLTPNKECYELLKKYGITTKDLAKWFEYSSTNSFRNSSSYQNTLKTLCKVILKVENSGKGKEKINIY